MHLEQEGFIFFRNRIRNRCHLPSALSFQFKRSGAALTIQSFLTRCAFFKTTKTRATPLAHNMPHLDQISVLRHNKLIEAYLDAPSIRAIRHPVSIFNWPSLVLWGCFKSLRSAKCLKGSSRKTATASADCPKLQGLIGLPCRNTFQGAVCPRRKR